MITALILAIFPLQLAEVNLASQSLKPKQEQNLLARQCGEVSRWYAWTQCGETICCKLFIACSDGTIISQVVDSNLCS